MTKGARIRNLVLIGHFRCDEAERMAPNIDVGDCLFDLRHVARHTITAGTAGPMVRVRFDASRVGAVW